VFHPQRQQQEKAEKEEGPILSLLGFNEVEVNFFLAGKVGVPEKKKKIKKKCSLKTLSLFLVALTSSLFVLEWLPSHRGSCSTELANQLQNKLPKMKQHSV
jgi:hypothetical protein